MEKLSGLVLDVYDDVGGHVMKGMYPELREVPEIVKTAMSLSQDQLRALPDDVFALVLHQGGQTLRKYACVDAGNTAAHVAYFMATYDKLPEVAVKTAAANLITACGWYDVEPPEELKKLSTGENLTIGRQRVWRDANGTYGHDPQSWDLHKTADVTGTADMPAQFGKNDVVAKKKPALSVAKTAEEKRKDVGRLVATGAYDKDGSDTLLAQAFGFVDEKAPEQMPQISEKGLINPHVDVTDKEPPKLIEEKKASYYALPYAERYPLDDYRQVKTASAYFNEYYRMMPPDDRHTFAVHLLERAPPLGIQVSEEALNYGSTKYASAEHVEACVLHRMQLLEPHAEKTASVHCIGVYKELLAQRTALPPATFARTLGEIDKLAGLDEFWDQDVIDPFASTFAKTAEQDDTSDTLVVGNEYMRVKDLKNLAANKPQILRRRFSEELVTEFQKDPVAIFESLPMDQKIVLMRIANDVNDSHLA